MQIPGTSSQPLAFSTTSDILLAMINDSVRQMMSSLNSRPVVTFSNSGIGYKQHETAVRQFYTLRLESAQ